MLLVEENIASKPQMILSIDPISLSILGVVLGVMSRGEQSRLDWGECRNHLTKIDMINTKKKTGSDRGTRVKLILVLVGCWGRPSFRCSLGSGVVAPAVGHGSRRFVSGFNTRL